MLPVTCRAKLLEGFMQISAKSEVKIINGQHKMTIRAKKVMPQKMANFINLRDWTSWAMTSRITSKRAMAKMTKMAILRLSKRYCLVRSIKLDKIAVKGLTML